MCRRIKDLALFDLPVNGEKIENLFIETHSHFQKLSPNWTLSATRYKMIYIFWFKEVFSHFILLLFLAVLYSITLGLCSQIFLQSLLLGSFCSFFILAVWIYWPAYFSEFLPKLDSIIDEKEQIRLAELERCKCRRTQYSCPSLVIIYFVYCKISEIPLLPANETSAELLNKLYGVDKDKLKQNLVRLCQLHKLSPKEMAEMSKGIANARDFFASLGYWEAAKILDKLELKMVSA